MADKFFPPGAIISFQVPEVSTLILLGAALVALALVARWKLKNKK
ncbi:MAG: PEP-CTERM sorting domain-containing protein [Deltaproteobacteria bacterium]|nr:PEP-CTERM sorting domain-containing protein [Deltaproteobacteria bacterium]